MHTDFTRYVVVNPIYVATSAKTLLRQCHAYGPGIAITFATSMTGASLTRTSSLTGLTATSTGWTTGASLTATPTGSMTGASLTGASLTRTSLTDSGDSGQTNFGTYNCTHIFSCKSDICTAIPR